MDAQKKANLQDGGVNVDAALDRFMGNEAMLMKYLNRFLNEKSYAALTQAINEDDKEAALAAAHTLKSVCGTIGCEGMSQMVINQELAMRQDKWDEAKNMMPAIEATYTDICAILKANI